MRSNRHFYVYGTLVVIGLVTLPLAQAKQENRIVQQIDNSQTVILKGNLNPRARSQYDQGRVEPDLRLGYITLMLKQSPQQQTQLKYLLEEQQNRSSPNYHKWVTPEQFAERFGVSGDDVDRIVSWLEEEGFAISHVARSRNWVSFRGAAAQVEIAFHTEIHRYKVDGELHFANATEPRIPRALGSVVMGLRGLDDFHPRPMGIERDLPSTNGHRWGPNFTDGAGNHFLAPDDLATIYDITPLYGAGFDGSGQRLVVVGQSDINLTDLEAFRSIFHLSANDPQQILVPGSTDPGFTKDQGEADLDLEWSGAVARNATIIYVNSTGVFNSAQYAIEQNLAPVISVSFGLCEPVVGSTDLSSLESLAQQANAQGITILAASGDSGAAGCDPAFTTAVASQGLTVAVPASLPEVTGVGGTEFNEGNGTYWGGNGPNFGSALSYIPEITWNDTSTALAASGGGASLFFAKPAWQTGPGVPSDGARDVPDVSLTASGHDGYLVCTNGGCGGGFPTSSFQGTSASAPSLAGVVVLLNQYVVSKGVQTHPGLGNINPNLYQFAQAATAAFHDVTSGNNIVPCIPGTPAAAPLAVQCPGSGFFGFSAGPGYDQVTGWGSIDANLFVTNLVGPPPDFTFVSSSTSMNVSRGSSGQTTLNLTSVNGFNGTVAFSCTGLPAESNCSFSPSNVTLNGTAASTTLVIQTTAPSAQIIAPSTRVPDGRNNEGFVYALLLPGVIGTLGFLRNGERVWRHRMSLGLALLIVLWFLGWTACGGGSSNAHHDPGTPQGSETVTVTATSSGSRPISHQVQIVLSVQ